MLRIRVETELTSWDCSTALIATTTKELQNFFDWYLETEKEVNIYLYTLLF